MSSHLVGDLHTPRQRRQLLVSFEDGRVVMLKELRGVELEFVGEDFLESDADVTEKQKRDRRKAQVSEGHSRASTKEKDGGSVR